MIELPVELPVWGWVLVGLGIIGAGIGLAYIIIFFFWRIIQPITRSVPVYKPEPVMKEPEPEVVPDPEPEPVEPEPEPEPEETDENIEEKVPEIMEEPIMEEMPAIEAIVPAPEKTMVRFAMNLTDRFNHPFNNVRSIICWNLSVQDGDEVCDSEGNVMLLRITRSGEQRQAVLVDETGERQIPLTLGKQYLKQETGLDVEKF